MSDLLPLQGEKPLTIEELRAMLECYKDMPEIRRQVEAALMRRVGK